MSINSNQNSREQSQLIFQNGLRLLQQGKFDEADKYFLEAHALDATNVDALNLLGIRAYQKQDYQSALHFLNLANQLSPNSAQTLSNLGLAHNALLNFSDALDCFNLAISCNPNIPETHNNRGNALKGLKRNTEALQAYQQALVLRPNYAEAFSNQGVIFLEDGDPEKAIPLFKQAIQINPNMAVAFNNLGNAFTQLESYNSAFQCFERALQINNNYLDACLNFGGSLKKCKQYDAAIDCYQHALKIDSACAKTFYALGEIYYEIGDCDLAKTYYAKSLDLEPENLEAHIALAIAQIPKVATNIEEPSKSRQAFSRQLDFLQGVAQQKMDAVSSAQPMGRHPFYLAYQDENNAPLLAQFGKICTDFAKPVQDCISTEPFITAKGGKIRIGIVSSFICQHPVWDAITKGWVNHLNPEQFEIFIFNTGDKEDGETEVAKLKAAGYIKCSANLIKTAQTIANQNLDVILYPEIGMDPISKSLACLRLAPTQAVSWGHPETTGLPTIDFYLSAQLLEPADANNLYSEQLIQLPNLGTYFERDFVEPVTPNLGALGLNPSLPILLCAGSPSKYSPENDYIFVEIAKKLEQCQFVFFNFDENLTSILKTRLKTAFVNAQLNPDQFLHFIPFLQKEEFHGLMQKADLYLDTIGFSGFNTAMQAITNELPVITIESNKMRGRLASAILHRIGLSELVCKSNSAYIQLVVELIRNRELLMSYRSQIAIAKGILFNDLEPIRALEDFLIERTRK